MFFQNSNGTTSISNINGNTIEFKTNATINSTSGVDQFRVSHTASAVNYVQVTGGATGGLPAISAQGSDSDVSLRYNSKGLGTHIFYNGGGAAQFRIGSVTSAVNYLRANAAITANASALVSEGTDTNISMAFQPKGTGAIDLAAGSSGVNISNGGTVTAITRTATGSGYTSFPSIAISAPTTAGGTTATASVFTVGTTSATVASGGTGYTVGNIISTNAGASQSSAATFTVTAVSSGVITAISSTGTGGAFTAIPTNPVATTGGSGSGATLNLSSFYIIGLSLLTAGSGYIEQPTITFSGGGGSGAAAYATVGSPVIFRSLAGNGSAAQSMSFHSSSGESLRVATSTTGGTSTNFVTISGGSTGNGPRVISDGSDGNIFLGFVTKGTGAFQFITNNASEQLRVSHTASAVNYVQVTGSATANIPIISTTGSDASVGMELRLKGTPTGPGFRVTNNNGSNVCFAVTTSGATPANYMRADPASASASPAMSAQGSDTNIDLALTPKGTGVVQFGTHTANADVAISGFITIRDAGGTLRKLAVIT